MRIPESTDPGPALGSAGIIGVRERMGYAQEGISAQLSGVRAAGDAIRDLGQITTRAGAALRAEEIRLAANAETSQKLVELAQADAATRDEVEARAALPSTDPNYLPPQNMRQAYLDTMAERFDQIHEGLQSDAAKYKTTQHGLALAANGHDYFTRLGAAKMADQGLANLDALGAERKRAEQLGDTAKADILRDEYDRLSTSLHGVLNENVLGDHRRQTEAGASQALFEGLLARDPTGTTAARMLDQHLEAFPEIDIVKAKEIAKTAGREGRLAALSDRWDAGTAGVADLDRALANGDMTALTRRAWLHERQEKTAKLLEGQVGRARVEDVLFAGGSPRPDDEKYRAAVGDYWTDVEGPKVAQIPVAEQLGHAAQFAGKVGVIPQPILGSTKGDLAAYGPNALDAARFVDTLRQASPGLLGSYTEHEQAAANAILSLGSVDRAKELASVPEPLKAARKLELQRWEKQHSFTELAQKSVEKEPGLFGIRSWPFGTSVPLPDSLVTQMHEVWLRTYQETGSRDAADRTMSSVPSADWGPALTGPPRLSRYAPERLYGQPGYGPDEMRADLLKEMVRPAIAGHPDWGTRFGSGEPKSTGWLGTFRTPDGGVTSEYSTGVEIDGKETEIPTLVPGLSQQQIDRMVNDIIPNQKKVPEDILRIAEAHAREQIAAGKSPFYNAPPAIPDLAKLSDSALLSRVEVSSDLLTAQSSVRDYGVTLMTDRGPIYLGRWQPNTPDTSPSVAAARAGEVESAKRKRAVAAVLSSLPAAMDSAAADPAAFDDLYRRLRGLDLMAPLRGGDAPEQVRAERAIALWGLAESTPLPRELLLKILGGEGQ